MTQPSFLQALIIALLLYLSAAANAMAQTADADRWRSSFTLYGWLTSVEGKLNYDLGGGSSASIDSEDVLDALDFTFMGAFEIRNEHWSLLTDVIYLKLSAGDTTSISLPSGTLMADTDQKLDGWKIGLAGTYEIYHNDQTTMNVLLGLRYLDVDAKADLTIDDPLPPELGGRHLSQSADFWDGIVGIRGQIGFAKNWFIPYHFDVGTGESDLTWQALAGIGYRADWGDTILSYRYLEWDTGEDGLLQDFSFSGPAMGVRFHF